jgi:hypothetical protein
MSLTPETGTVVAAMANGSLWIHLPTTPILLWPMVMSLIPPAWIFVFSTANRSEPSNIPPHRKKDRDTEINILEKVRIHSVQAESF